MLINNVHTFEELKEEDMKEIQIRLKKGINLNFDNIEIKYVAGVDLAYFNINDEEWAICVIVIVDYKTKKIIKDYKKLCIVNFEYITGYLAFRELPLFLETWKMVKEQVDIVIFDGQGILHPQRMGIATHASFFLNKPTIGVGKSFLKFNSINMLMPENNDDSYTYISENNDIVGICYRVHKNVKPIFISPGNYIDFDTSLKVIKNLVTIESRIPIPTRIADIYTKKYRKEYIENKINNMLWNEE